MTQMIRPGFTGSTLDRVDHVRDDADALAALRSDPSARLLLLDGIDPVLDPDFRLSWTGLADAPDGADLALLGLTDGKPRFAALTDVPHAAMRSPRFFQLLPHMPNAETANYAAARSLIDWHNRHRFCAQCGSSTTTIRAGWARACSGCGAQHFPRTDPVVIMLAEHEDSVLIGRQPMFPPNMFSALAGFIEVGESLEEAVVRELREEAGIAAHSVRYVASQPWPFPSSLMIACIASTDSRDIVLDTNELEAAMWCSRAEVLAAIDGAPDARFEVPAAFAIANTLLTRWARG